MKKKTPKKRLLVQKGDERDIDILMTALEAPVPEGLRLLRAVWMILHYYPSSAPPRWQRLLRDFRGRLGGFLATDGTARSLDEAFDLPTRKRERKRKPWVHGVPGEAGLSNAERIFREVRKAHREGHSIRQPDETAEEEDAFDIAAARLMQGGVDLAPETIADVYYRHKGRRDWLTRKRREIFARAARDEYPDVS